MAKDDVSPGLFNKISNAFKSNLAANKKAQRLANRIESGSATYKDAGGYAECVGNALSAAMKTYLTSEALPDGKMYWHIAEDVLEPLLKEEYNIISTAAAKTQQSLNSSAGMGLKAIKTKYDRKSVENIMGMACSAEQYSNIAVEMGETMVTFARDIVDQTLKANVDFQGDSGRTPRVIRTAGAKCCPWCADLEGTYEYPNVPADVYKHHDYCKCDLEYEDAWGKSNVWTKDSTTPEERDKIEERKNFGLSNTKVSREQLKHFNASKNTPLKMDLQFFAEKGLSKQSSAEIKRGIQSIEKNITLHENKIKNPKNYISEWDKIGEAQKEGTINFWNKEIRNMNQQIKDRINELKARGDYDE